MSLSLHGIYYKSFSESQLKLFCGADYRGSEKILSTGGVDGLVALCIRVTNQ